MGMKFNPQLKLNNLINANKIFLIKMEELLNRPDTCAILEKEYHFTPKMFYEENKKRQFYSYELYKKERDLRYELQKVKESNRHQQDHIDLLLEIKNQQQEYIEQLQNSISWKITKPIRNLRKIKRDR